ncbi:hypothetical protein O3M35_005450 [Rhynocoris fuscipes]|uniref:Uncharacterized protein n=1 Tax=Rhynocoris fuscipes TaxID=488301 RepID=A0AAW1DP47_9HEMI
MTKKSDSLSWTKWDPPKCEEKNFKGTVEFGGLLPACHPARVCHHESLRKKGLLKDIRTVLKRLDEVPPCDQWDPLIGVQGLKRIPEKGPHRFGVYRPKGKPWECNRVKSCELIGSKLIKFCACCNKNGLQDECARTQCRGKPWCMFEPLPKCPPFTCKPGYYHPPDPHDVCLEQRWKSSPEYDAYEAMKRRHLERTNEGCFPNPPQAICHP